MSRTARKKERIAVKCMECGQGRMRRQIARIAHEIRGLLFEVEGEALVCSHCGFQMIPSDLIVEHGRLVEQAYSCAMNKIA